jgi:hypothetical protein
MPVEYLSGKDLAMQKVQQKARGTAWRAAATSLLAMRFLSWLAGPASAQDPSSPRGELRIEGQYIHKVNLEGEQSQELTDPCGVERVPVGAYVVQSVELKGGFVSAGQMSGRLGKIVVTEDTPTVLKAGGPLRQEITASRQGRLLILNYRLVGVGGENYRNSLPGRAPRFTVLRGDKAIGSGHFEYG